MTRDPWKLVTSVDELRAGMCVELRPNMETGKTDRVLLLRMDPRVMVCPNCKLWGPTKFDWFAATDGYYCFVNAIPERRLYALIDDDTAADETTVTRRREMVE